MTFSEGVKALAAYWGNIVQAAATRAGVAGAWASIRAGGATFATAEVKPSILDMNQLYGLAVANRTAMETLNSAGPDAVLTGAMIGLTLNARTPSQRNAAPEYVIRTQIYGTDATGNEVSRWLSITTLHQLPPTVETLDQQLGVQIAAAGVGYGITTVEYSTVSIAAI